MPVMHGKNLAKIKQQNLESIKATLYRYAPLSRAEIAERLALTPPTITNIVSELIQQGVVQELPASGQRRAPRGGPKAHQHRPGAGDRGWRWASRWGVTTPITASPTCGGGVRAQGTFDLMPEDYDAMVRQLLRILNTLEKRHPAEWNLLIGVGITIPGIVNPHTGVIKNHGSERISWCGQPLGTTISEAIHLPVRLENNVRARACAVVAVPAQPAGGREAPLPSAMWRGASPARWCWGTAPSAARNPRPARSAK